MAAVDLNPSAPLCLCGARGCDFAVEHDNAFVTLARGRRQPRGPVRRRRGKRT